ncbi:D-aminoacyl-tRNA deacylase [Oceanivirga salmonicida]|uniref:D-aminoacyl-tRNA deacylase n=1 Tax=Oceanivirga salmonicida TaxID=1769291 RepID=UPI00082F79F6|nr:D-aminoacyl-tRNA deacylase [Oceanivirga salmonicida]
MKLLIQRVSFANITINSDIEKKMEYGLLVYLGIKKDDDYTNIDKAINKLLKLRFFENEEGKLKKNIKDINGSIMVVSSFSLYAKADKGTTLSFDDSANHELAQKIYDKFVENLKIEYDKVVTGKFKSDMDIISNATGPVNVILEF